MAATDNLDNWLDVHRDHTVYEIAGLRKAVAADIEEAVRTAQNIPSLPSHLCTCKLNEPFSGFRSVVVCAKCGGKV